MTPYVMATRTRALATEAEVLLKATRHRRVTDKRTMLNISMNLAVALQNLRECSAKLYRVQTSKKYADARKKGRAA